MRRSSSSWSQSRPSSTSNSVAKQVDSGVGDLLLDQHPRQRVGQGRCAAHRRTPGSVVDHPVDAGGRAPRCRRVRSPGTSRCAAGCAPACDRARRRRSRWRAASRRARRRRPRRRSRSCRRPRSALPDRPRTESANSTARSPAVEVGRRRRAAPERTTRARRLRASTRSGRRAAAGSRSRACCRSGPCASSRARSSARGTRAASGRRRRRARRSARSRPGSAIASQRPPSAPKPFCGAK